MKSFRANIIYFITGILLLFAVYFENKTLHRHPEVKLIEEFQETLLKQESRLSVLLDREQKKLTDIVNSNNIEATFSKLNTLFEDEGLGFLIFYKQKLVFWSNNQFAFSNIAGLTSNQKRLLTLPNGIFVSQKRVAGDYEIIGLIHLKNNFSYENQYLQNVFVQPFNLPATFKISDKKADKSFDIKGFNGEYLFSVIPESGDLFNQSQLAFPATLYLLAFFFLLLSLLQIIKHYREENFLMRMALMMAALFTVYWVHIIFGVPVILNELPLFSSQTYAVSSWLPSFGDFLLITVLFFFWCFVFVREFPDQNHLRKKYYTTSYLLVATLYVIISFLIENLIENSNITYKLNRITDINQYSVGGYLSIAVLLFSAFLIHLKIVEKTERLNSRPAFFFMNLIGILLFSTLSFYAPSGLVFILTLFFTVNLLLCQIKKTQVSVYSLPYSILLISLFSVFSLLIVYNVVKKSDLKVQKVQAVTLYSEQDLVAEVYLNRIQTQINADSIIQRLLIPPYIDLENYLSRTYFSGYFRKYEVQFTPCTEKDSLFVQPENVFVGPCFPYFDKMIEQDGLKIPGTAFYQMNNMNGKISYLGKLKYQVADIGLGVAVFISINSKSISEGIGFPELLMDRAVQKPVKYKYISYAKYFDGELVSRSGSYDYNYYLQSYHIEKNAPEFDVFQKDGFNHLVYSPDQKNHIVVSSKFLNFIDYVISFPYIFVFYFSFVIFISLIGNEKFRKFIFPQDLRFRIQAAIISVVLVSLLLVASGTIYYNISDYRERHRLDLQEKIKSISQEIKAQLGYTNSISPEIKQKLYDDLYKLSNIFRTDINIYGANGELIATSRPEIFDRGLTTERMNSRAFYEVSENFQLNYLQPEQIGKLSYLSAYEPIINENGQYLGYLNLPYFTKEDELKQEISTFVVAFINLYLILFLASVVVAIFISNRITKPLSLIRENLRGIQLGKKAQQIKYKVKDEIGDLVREYNHKIEELAESAELLARSERESAWREMAKQIAHEIKNPLTPMKLNIQYLQRAKDEKNEQYNEFFDRVTQNLIEQIDTLSGIATEFSNFAQIPKAKNDVVNLLEIIQKTRSLFEQNPDLEIQIEAGELREILIFADKEQISRVFLNLIKNAIQSIPPDRQGKIKIRVQKNGQFATTTISDNGSGISKDVQAHLFEPNFTTKTSGMGLGLSIVRSIVVALGGNIWYETSDVDGTSFYVEIPLYEKP